MPRRGGGGEGKGGDACIAPVADHPQPRLRIDIQLFHKLKFWKLITLSIVTKSSIVYYQA